MNIIILGAGQVGYHLAKYLLQDHHRITIVDHNNELLEHIMDQLDIQPILGFGSYPNVLEAAGVRKADLLIAVTASDEVNIVACDVAASMAPNLLRIARIRHRDYWKNNGSKIFNSAHVIISPEIEVAKSIHKSTKILGAFELVALSHDFKMIGTTPTKYSIFLNTPFKKIPNVFPHTNISWLLIKRDDDYLIPHDDDCLMMQDHVYVIVHKDHVSQMMEAFGYNQKEERNLMIIGGGHIGRQLAYEIEHDRSSINLKIIETDEKKCHACYQYLSQTKIIHGDGLNIDVLNDAYISECETLLSLTNDDKVNVLSCLLSKRLGVKRTLCLLNNNSYASLVMSLGIDSIINPRSLTISSILQHVQINDHDPVKNIAESSLMVMMVKITSLMPIFNTHASKIPYVEKISVYRHHHLLDNIHDIILEKDDILIIVFHQHMLKKIKKFFSINKHN
jgi:trk system potassium uptake protein TrkA